MKRTPLLCYLFGHVTPCGYSNLRQYFSVNLGYVDGIGRMHAALSAKCERCGSEFHIGNIHVPVQPAVALLVKISPHDEPSQKVIENLRAAISRVEQRDTQDLGSSR